jgi:chromosome segregation ATPase
MTSLARYMQYLFNLQHNTVRTIMQQCMRLTAYEKHTTTISRELERLRHENAILRNSARPLLEQDHELQVTYHWHSEAKHGWNHIHMLLDITHEEVDTRTHGIIHLENHVETQNAKLEERAEMITKLEQQLLHLQGPVPPPLVDHEEIDATSGVDED